MSLNLLPTDELHIVPADFTYPTFEAPALPDREVITQRLSRNLPPPYEMAQAVPGQTERTSFALAGDSSGELPVIVTDAAETARISIPVTYGTPAEPEPEPEPEPRRPWFFRGTRRWTRSRALLVAATWPGGVR